MFEPSEVKLRIHVLFFVRLYVEAREFLNAAVFTKTLSNISRSYSKRADKSFTAGWNRMVPLLLYRYSSLYYRELEKLGYTIISMGE